jgi:hypothetical protein
VRSAEVTAATSKSAPAEFLKRTRLVDNVKKTKLLPDGGPRMKPSSVLAYCLAMKPMLHESEPSKVIVFAMSTRSVELPLNVMECP